jgi:hypothetical protein
MQATAAHGVKKPASPPTGRPLAIDLLSPADIGLSNISHVVTQPVKDREASARFMTFSSSPAAASFRSGLGASSTGADLDSSAHDTVARTCSVSDGVKIG